MAESALKIPEGADITPTDFEVCCGQTCDIAHVTNTKTNSTHKHTRKKTNTHTHAHSHEHIQVHTHKPEIVRSKYAGGFVCEHTELA